MKYIAYASILFLSMLPNLCGAGQTEYQPTTFDGTWWLSVSENEKLGFIEGNSDCYGHEYKGPDTYSDIFDDYVTRVTERYENGAPLDLKQSVVSELHALRDRPGEKFVGQGGEPAPVPDGLVWIQIDTVPGPETEHRGYIEGYLAYHDALNHGAGKVFSKSADIYVKDIDAWYGYVRSTGDMNPDREDTPIADVLFMFADKPASSKPAGG